MTLEPPSRLQRTVYSLVGSVLEFFVSGPQLVNGRAAAADEARPLFRPVLLAKRSLDSHTRRNIILGSVLGSVGFIALVLCLFLLLRYHRRRATSDENAMAASMVIQDPNQVYLESRQKPVLDVPPAPPPKPVYTPYTPQRIPNHPYASPYSRNASLPYTAPPQPSIAAPRQTAPRSAAPNSKSRRTPQPLAPLATLHPYSSRRDDIPQPQPSANPSDITYESFMSPLAPSIPEAEHSPVASTAGGGVDNSTRNRITTFSNNTTDTTGSRSSSAPLQARNHHPYRR